MNEYESHTPLVDESNIPQAHLALLIRASEHALEPGEEQLLADLLLEHPEYELVLRELEQAWDALDLWRVPTAPASAQSRFRAAVRRQRRANRVPFGPWLWRSLVPLAAAAIVALVLFDFTESQVSSSPTEAAVRSRGAAPSSSGGLVHEGYEPAPARHWRPSGPPDPQTRAGVHLTGWDYQQAGLPVGIQVRGEPRTGTGDRLLKTEYVRPSGPRVDESTAFVRPGVIGPAIVSSL